jgi:hypothetical protein
MPSSPSCFRIAIALTFVSTSGTSGSSVTFVGFDTIYIVSQFREIAMNQLASNRFGEATSTTNTAVAQRTNSESSSRSFIGLLASK